MSKQRKEILAAIVDGLDILVGLDKPEEKEKEKTSDSFANLLQSLIQLMIIPQILPLFQQALGQTLRDTTVNVKVESATSIIPIDITATTAIVPIEIRASQVTLNVSITGSTVTLNVNIASSDITLNVNVTNTILNVNVTNSSIDIRIIGSTVALDVNITGSLVTLNVNIASSAVTLNVNVTNSYLNVNIVSQTTVLNVNITGSVTLNVNVVGDAMVVIKAQQVGLYLGDTWGAIQGRHVDLTGFSWLDPFSEQLVAQFYPNPGEQYLIEGISASYILPKDTNVRPNLIVFRIYTGELTIIDNLVASLNVTREKPTDFINLMRAIPVSSDEPLKIVATSYSPMRVGVQATVYLYKV